MGRGAGRGRGRTGTGGEHGDALRGLLARPGPPGEVEGRGIETAVAPRQALGPSARRLVGRPPVPHTEALPSWLCQSNQSRATYLPSRPPVSPSNLSRQPLPPTPLRPWPPPGRGARRGGSGLLSGTASEERERLAADMAALLAGAVPRRYGEQPAAVGGFTTRLAPSPFHDRLLRLRRPLP